MAARTPVLSDADEVAMRPLVGAAAARGQPVGPAVAFADPPIFDPIALEAHNASVREHRRCRVARCLICKHASKGPLAAVLAIPTTADVENDGDRGPRASTDRALAPQRPKPFPMPGTSWMWRGNEQAPTPTGPHRVESLRWFRGCAEAVFAVDARYPGYACAGVDHMMGLDAWEPVESSRDPLAAIDAAAQGQHARAMVDLTWGAWRPPPRRRLNVTSTARLADAGKVHLTIDLDANGQPCAIWVEVHKEGSIVRGMLDCVATLASQALQHGASIHEVAERMIGVRFEPDGAVEGHATVRECLSIVDLLGRMIEAEFPRAAARRAGGGS